MKEMDEKKICFIICTNSPLYLQECKLYLERLTVPDGYETDLLCVEDASSMAAGYMEGMECSDAKYKIYLHQDVFILNPYFLDNIIHIFQSDEKIGLIGMVGTKAMPADAVMWHGDRFGGLYYRSTHADFGREELCRDISYEDAVAVDGLLMATSVDVDWRQDLFDGWDLYDVSQSMEFLRKGLRVVVPLQKDIPWCLHDDDAILNLWNYDIYRRRCLEEYPEFFHVERPEVKAVRRAAEWMRQGDFAAAEKAVYAGLKENPSFYELYLTLGELKEWQGRFRQAFFCYAQAICDCGNGDKAELEAHLECFRQEYPEYCGRISIRIMNRESASGKLDGEPWTMFCPEALCGEIMQLTGYDGKDSAPALLERMRETTDGAEQDVLLLDAEMLPVPHALFNLCMALYEEGGDYGGVGGVCDDPAYAWQYVNPAFERLEETIAFGQVYNCYDPAQIETRIRAGGFAYIIKNEALSAAGGWDKGFAGMEYAIQDLQLRMLMAGYRTAVCQTGFFCALARNNGATSALPGDRELFRERWKLELDYYVNARTDLIGMMRRTGERPPRVLEVGCGVGSTLLRIQFDFPGAEVHGLELSADAVRIASKLLNVRQGDIEKDVPDIPVHYFDYILFGDVLEHLREPGQTLNRLKEFLNDNGRFLASIPNVQHYSASIPLLYGKFEYQDSGILDRTHLRFFTKKSAAELFEGIGCEVEEIVNRNLPVSKDVLGFLEELCRLSPGIVLENFLALQYLVKARLGSGRGNR